MYVYSAPGIGSVINSLAQSMSATPLSNKKPLPPSKYVCLSEWWLAKPLLQYQGLAVGGVAYGKREKVFLSTGIAKRYEANVLETEDGIIVQVRGMINSARTSENGFPSKVCEDFLLGFPDDWKKYTTHNFAEECVDRVTGFGDSSACLPKSGDMMNKVENGVLDECVDRVSGFGNSNACSPKRGDTMNNGENGVSDVAIACQAGNPKYGQPLMGVNEPNPCTGLAGKSMAGSPISTKKIRKDQSSSDYKEKQHSRCNKDVGKTCSRIVTRSFLKRSHTLLREEDKVTASSVGRSISRRTHTSLLREEEKVTPTRFGTVRRSPRLYNCRKSLYESP